MRSGGLSQHASRGLLWSALEVFGSRGVQFIIQVSLARILSPEDFGLVAMVIVFITLATGIVDAGMTQALIQRRKLVTADLSTIFILNLALAGILITILWLGAGPISGFYRQPILQDILRTLSVVLALDALGRVHLSILQKNLKFEKIFLVSLPAVTFSGCVSIVLAWRGFGAWALVWQQISQRGIQMILLWIISRVRFSLRFSLKSFKELFPFGVRLATAGVINQLFLNFHTLVIGKTYGGSVLGYYQQAENLKNQLAFNLVAIVHRVTFSVFSSLQNDPRELAAAFVRFSKLVSLTVTPLIAVLGGASLPLITGLFGEKWRASASLFKILCLSGALIPISVINLNVISAVGDSKSYLRLEIIKRIIYLLVLLFTWKHGVIVIAAGYSTATIVSFLLNCRGAARVLGMSILEQLRPLIPAAFIAGLAFSTSQAISSISIFESNWLQLGFCLMGGVLAIVAGAVLVRKQISDELQIIKDYFIKVTGRFGSVR